MSSITQQLQNISKELTKEFGKGYDVSNLQNMRRFYLAFPIQDSVSPKLSWTHYRVLIRIENKEAKQWYMQEAIANSWSVRALERQISKLYYERLLSSKEKSLLKQEAQEKTKPLQIDLVFYNFKLKCFLLIDLKLGKLTHQDVGQMDTYVRVYDEFYKNEDDNPTIGLILCSEDSKAVAKYSILNDSEQLFSSKYLHFYL